MKENVSGCFFSEHSVYSVYNVTNSRCLAMLLHSMTIPTFQHLWSSRGAELTKNELPTFVLRLIAEIRDMPWK